MAVGEELSALDGLADIADGLVRLLLERLRDDVRLDAVVEEVRCGAHRVRRRVREAEEARIRREARIDAHGHFPVERHGQLLHEVVDDLSRRRARRCDITVFCRAVVRLMMIDIEEMRRVDGLHGATRAVRRRVEHDEQVGLYGLFLVGSPNNIISRQHRKDGRDIIIEQNGSFLAERAQDVHEPERGPDGVAVRILVGCDDDPLSARQDGCCFTQCHYHVNVLLS